MVRYGILITGLITTIYLVACQTPGPSATSTPLPATGTTESLSPTVEPTQTAAPTSTATITPVEEPLPAVTSTPVEEVQGDAISGVQEEIKADDGLHLIGTFYAPVEFEPPWPGVILLHMLWSERTTWDEYALQLADSGFAVFALDMRGHGETGGELDWDLAAVDLQQVWDNLAAKPDIDADRMGIIGASIGANIALVGGANEPDVRTVVLLSPGLSYAGVGTKEAMVAFGERPAFIAASQEDTYAADSSRKLHEIAVGEARLDMYQDAGHGTFMLENELELGEQIVEWLQEYLQ